MRRRQSVIKTVYREDITVAQSSEFVREHSPRYGLLAKDANRYRPVLRGFLDWGKSRSRRVRVGAHELGRPSETVRIMPPRY